MIPALLKFKNSEMVIAEINEHPNQEFIFVSRPVEIVLTAVVTDEGTVETFNMRPWISLSAESSFVVEKSEIMLTAIPSDTTIAQYDTFIEKYYGYKKPKVDIFSMSNDLNKRNLLN